MPEDPDDYDSFYDKLTELLSRFDVLERIFIGLPVVSDFDRFYLRAFQVYYYFCRLVVLVRIIRLLRTHIPKANCNSGFLAAKFRWTGAMHAIKCARTALVVSDATLAAILSTQEDELLATAPDAFFSMIMFAAAFLVMAKFMLLHSQNVRRIPGCTDPLLARAIVVLQRVATAPDHPAARCAKVMVDFIATWEDKIATRDNENIAQNLQADHGNRDETNNTQAPLDRALPETAQLNTMPQLPDASFGLDGGFVFGQDAVFGDEFWQYISQLPPMPLPTTPFAYHAGSSTVPQ